MRGGVKREFREVAVGGIAMAALMGAIALSYGDREAAAAGGYTIEAGFNRVDGIAVGTPVELAGIRVGSVERLRLDGNYRPVATLRLSSGLRLPKDTGAAIHTDGLFGAKFVQLDPGGDADTLNDGDRIALTQDAVVVDELLELIIAEGKAHRAKMERPTDTPEPQGRR